MDYNHISYTRCKEIILEREYIIDAFFLKNFKSLKNTKAFSQNESALQADKHFQFLKIFARMRLKENASRNQWVKMKKVQRKIFREKIEFCLQRLLFDC
jgi:hypothetical protein